MRVLIAGASGVVGRRLVTELVHCGHDVLGLTRNLVGARRLAERGAQPVVADAMDRSGLLGAVRGLRADAVIHELTALGKPPARHRDMHATDRLRVAGTANLLAAARALGAKRFVTQSMIFGYGFVQHGTAPVTEEAPFGHPRGDRCDPHVRAMGAAEEQTFAEDALEGIALRYGLFYGPGASDAVVRMLRRRAMPIPARGGGLLPWIHIDDAATATIAALTRGGAGQAYNIVDDEPVSWATFFTTAAEALGAPAPRRLAGWAMRLVAPHAATMMLDTSMLASNAKAKRELGWSPATPSYRVGLPAMARAHA